MAKGKLTGKAISSLRSEAKDKGKPVIRWDTELRGFGARAAPDGRVTWVFQHYIGKHQKRLAFNHCPPLELDDARKEAEKLRADVNRGIDVLDRKAQQRKARIAALEGAKLGETVERYLKRHYQPDASKPSSYGMQVKRIFESKEGGVIETLGKDTLVASITKSEVRALLNAKRDAGNHGYARYVFAVLRPFFKWCVEEDLMPVSPLADLQAPAPSEARDRVLTDTELKSLWEATDDMGDLWRPFYRLLILTGQRREEVAGIGWSELDTDAGLWTIPPERTKNGKEHVVHLSPQALAVIETVDRREKTDLLFTTTLETAISGYGKAKARLDGHMKEALEVQELKPWRVHDLRRTAASGMAKLGFQPHIVERVLNHVSGAQGGLVGVYQRYEYLDDRKRALHSWGDYVETVISGAEKASNIVSFTPQNAAKTA